VITEQHTEQHGTQYCITVFKVKIRSLRRESMYINKEESASHSHEYQTINDKSMSTKS